MTYREGDRVHVIGTVVAGDNCLKVALDAGIDDVPLEALEVAIHEAQMRVGDRVKIIGGKDGFDAGEIVAMSPSDVSPVQCWVRVDGKWSLTTFQPCQLARIL
jgi:hypothetical protein